MHRRKLLRELAWVVAIKFVALTAIYYAFFVPPAHDDSRSRVATVLFSAGPSQR